ncbi:hypothetical protein V8C34DRAFT_285372, partial [Trichoderma compactum]
MCRLFFFPSSQYYSLFPSRLCCRCWCCYLLLLQVTVVPAAIVSILAYISIRIVEYTHLYPCVYASICLYLYSYCLAPAICPQPAISKKEAPSSGRLL